MDRKAFLIAAGAGTALQLALVVSGHFVVFIADNLFAIGGVLISLIAGLLYGRLGRGARKVLWGGGAGALCAFIGIAVSAALGDVAWLVLVFGTIASALAGAAGAGLAALRPRRRS